jgi:hypothetical protein
LLSAKDVRGPGPIPLDNSPLSRHSSRPVQGGTMRGGAITIAMLLFAAGVITVRVVG